MRNAISTASDAEIMSALHDLESMQALETVHLMPVHQTQNLQDLSTPLQNIQTVQTNPALVNIQSLENNQSLNLQSLINDSLKQQNNNVVEEVAKNVTQDIQVNTQKALQEQQSILDNKIATEANAKLVSDLKTISAVIEAKQDQKNQQTEIIKSFSKPGIEAAPLIGTTEAIPRADTLLKNATQAVDGFLADTAEKEAIKQVQDAFIIKSEQQGNTIGTTQREQLIQNATKAIEGLIDIKAEKMAHEKEAALSSVQAVVPIAPKQTTTPSPSVEDPVTAASVAKVINSAVALQQANAMQQATLQQQLQQQVQQVQQSNQYIQQQTNIPSIPTNRAQDIVAKVSHTQSTVAPQMPQTTTTTEQEFQSDLQKITQTIAKDYNSKAQGVQITVPKADKVLDFLSSAGKITTILLAITPLPTYLGTWNKPRKEQVERVESISYTYLLLCILCNSVWTSYAFKTQNIDLAIISVIPLIIAIILAAIHLSVKPESSLIKQFFFVILVSQIFNFDLVPIAICGSLGTLASIMTNVISLTFMPHVIQTRDVSGINMPMTVINLSNLVIWESYAALKGDPFMTLSQFLGIIFNSIIVMFYFWAKNKINSQDTPNIWIIMRQLIWFFKLFTVQKQLKEMQNLFWVDESSKEAQAYIKQYQDDISELERQNEDASWETETSYEQHMSNMRRINNKLRSMKDGKNYADNESNFDGSTNDGSSHQQYANNKQQYNQRMYPNQNQQQYYNRPEEQFYAEDSMSMNSFNSSMNFQRLQNQINTRMSTNHSESTSYFKSKFQNMSVNHNYVSKKHQEQFYQNQAKGGNHFDESTILLDDMPHQNELVVRNSSIEQVQEAKMEDEQSERCHEEPRSSVASLISMIQPQKSNMDDSVSYMGDNENYSQQTKFDNLRQRAQKLKQKKKEQKANQSINHVDMEQVNLGGEQAQTNLSLDEDEQRLLSNNSVNSGSLENSEQNTDLSQNTINFNKSSQNIQEALGQGDHDIPMNNLGKP